MRKLAYVVCALALSGAGAGLAAQTGAIQGAVMDASGATIPGARITAIDAAKNVIARETVTAADGAFSLQSLLRGQYNLRIEAAGFKTVERTGITLDPNQVLNLGRIEMSVGATTESITVEASVPLVETSTAQKSYVITSRQVTELALNGRNFSGLLRTLPGVVSNAQSDFRLVFNETNDFNVNGLRASMNNVFLDGTINTDVGDNGGQYTQLNIDAVGEFKVQTSVFNAEYGRNPGVLISATTKAGGSEFHGVLYHFFRNDAMDARPPFDTTGRKAFLRFNQFGGNLGGPALIPGLSSRTNQKLFFFFAFEGARAARPNGGNFINFAHPDLLEGNFQRLLRYNPDGSSVNITGTTYNVGTVFQPGTVVRNAAGVVTFGQPFPNNIVPKAMWNQNAEAFLKILRRANYNQMRPGPAANPELVELPLRDTYRFNKEQYVARVDYNLGSKTSLFWRMVQDPQDERVGLGIWGTTPFPVYPMFRKKPGSSYSWNLIQAFSPTRTNELIVAYAHQSQLVDAAPGVDPSTYDRDKLGFKYQQIYPSANVRNRFPRFSCGIGSCSFGGFASGWENDGKDYAITDNFTMILGRHTVKTGGFFNWDNKIQQPSWNDAGTFSFGTGLDNPNDTNVTFANMLLGNYLSFNQDSGKFLGKFRFYGAEGYLQDSFRASRRLTLEYGARWVYVGPTYTYGTILASYFDPSRFDPAKAVTIDFITAGARRGSIVPGSGDPINGMVREGSPGVAKGFGKHRWNQWSPRFGFTVDPRGDGRTAIRGGFGTFFERVRQNINNFDGLGNPPVLDRPTLYAGNIDNLGPHLLAGGTRFPVNLSAFEKENKTPTIYSWSLNIQQQLPGAMAIDAGYVGNVARHLQYRRDVNTLPLGATINDPNLLRNVNNVSNAIRPYRGYASIPTTDNNASSNYHSLQTRLSRRFGRDLTFNINYTWSKTISDAEADGDSVGYAFDRKRDRAPANFDRTQTLTFDYIYRLPGFGAKLSSHALVKGLLDGWQISGITRYWTGFPLTVTSNGNPGTLGGGVRANYLGGDVIPAVRDRYNWFNPLAFGRPPDGDLGNTGRGILRGPIIRQWDISLFKEVQFAERYRAQFRLETFNTFNNVMFWGVSSGISVPNPNTPVTQATRGTTGQVTSTRDPRNVQLALKFYF